MSSENLKPFGTRLDEDLITEVKVHSSVTKMRVQDIVEQALRDFLADHAEDRCRLRGR